MSPRRSLLPDLAAIALFAAIGRSSHAEGVTIPGLLLTAWPFFAGCLAGTAVAFWRRLGFWPSAVVIWLSTVALGMILRVLTGPGTQLSFTIVATITLGVLMLGWRAVATLVARMKASRKDRRSGPGFPNGESAALGSEKR